jgi:heptosyltransferase I
LHATSADHRLWPEASWLELHKYLILNNIISILPWGNEIEHARSTRLAAAMGNAIVPPALTLEELAALLSRAHAVVGVDTGLTHLAAALDAPTVGIYCATDPAATGLHAGAHATHVGDIGASPAVGDVISALERVGAA